MDAWLLRVDIFIYRFLPLAFLARVDLTGRSRLPRVHALASYRASG